MDNRNGECFDHNTLFGHMSSDVSLEDETCLNDYLLDSSTHDKLGYDALCFPNNKPLPFMDPFNCSNPNLLTEPGNLPHSGFSLDVPPLTSILADFNTPSGHLGSNVTSMTNCNNNNLTCGDYSIDENLPFVSVNSKIVQQPTMHESSTLVNRTVPQDAAIASYSKNMVLDSMLPTAHDGGYDLIGSNNSSYMTSPIFGVETMPASCKMDSDPFSPSISSSVSSIPSVEMPDKSSYIPGSVDSGVIVNGSSSSPFSTSDSNRNGECSSINDSLISPLTQGPGSERSVETTPGSESVSSEMCSPRVDFEMLSLELSGKNKVKQKPKSHKGRKRKNEQKKEKVAKAKKQTIIMPTYQSQISPGQNGIKLKISLANPGPLPVSKRRRKHKKPSDKLIEPEEQSEWGSNLPVAVLTDIFRIVTEAEGCLPSLIRLSQVCKLWRDVALSPDLWYNIDLSNKWISKNPIINEYNFAWFCENRLSRVQELNLGGWTFLNVAAVLEKIVRNCPELSGIAMSGWEFLNADHVKYLASSCPNLQRVNLSGISSIQSSNNKSGVALNSLLFMASEIGERLTHLVLSDNKLVGIPQLITALATHCPNLELLDLSNVKTLTATGHIHVEKLQEGCQKLRILRITNSQVSLTPVPLKDQMASPGFPLLEELSVACMVNSLSSCTQQVVDDEAIERILKSSTKLRLLDARNCSKVTDSSLVRVPAWDLTHLYLSGSYVTRNDSGLELIAQKWSHSLIEVDFAWSTVTKSLDAAVTSLAEQGDCSELRILDLTGSSINLAPVQAVLRRCPKLTSLNLSACRALPRGMKKNYDGPALAELKASLVKSDESSNEGQESPLNP